MIVEAAWLEAEHRGTYAESKGARMAERRTIVSRILIVDDSEEDLAECRTFLSDEGFETSCARDGLACLQCAVEEAPDLILLDVTMPGMDGITTCAHLKKNAETADIPVLVVSAEHDEERIVAALDAGAQDYVTRPINKRILATRVRSALRTKQDQDEKKLLRLKLQAGNRELEEINARFEKLSLEDALTAIGNRRAMELALESLHAAAVRFGRSYSVVLFDVDHFKLYNERYGDPAGDDVLRSIADYLVSHIRRSDRVYRFGGEELLVVFQETLLPGATIISERLRAGVEALDFEHAGVESGTVTVSGGVACENGRGKSKNAVLEAAHRALYLAKHDGRNQVAAWTETEEEDEGQG